MRTGKRSDIARAAAAPLRAGDEFVCGGCLRYDRMLKYKAVADDTPARAATASFPSMDGAAA